jgi:hypothetical protein
VAPNTFPLTGLHIVPPRTCADCHASGVYKGLATTCYPCHKVTYDSTSNPVHTQAGFNTSCVTCHTSTTTWGGASFNHTWFPVNHHGSTCAQCHTTPSYLVFSCRGCHGDTHKKGYTDLQCYSCHMKG